MSAKKVVYSYNAPVTKRKIGGRTYWLQNHFTRRADAEKYAEDFRKQGRSARVISFRGNYEVFTTMKRGEFQRRR